MIYRSIREYMSRLNIIFIVQLVAVIFVAIGFLPRQFALYLAVGLGVYFLTVPLDEAIIFFVRSIPLFIAIPITAGFDSLTSSRVFSIIIFLRWLDMGKFKGFFRFRKSDRIQLVLSLLFILAAVSISQAESYILAIKRLIFIVNLSLIGIIIYDYARNHKFTQRLVRNIAIPTVIVAIVGLLQLISTYLIDIFQFVDFWGNVIERNLFGNVWANTALKANTWFAYFGDQISLRMFSSFPDSHSFPIFLVLGLPAVLAVSLDKIIAEKGDFKSMLHTRARMLIVFVPLIFLDIILTGTRGMWAAGAVSLLWVVGYWLYLKKRGPDGYHKSVFKYVTLYLSLFLLLFTLAYPIFASPQFEISKESAGLLARRVRSVIDFAETSNSRRLGIWRDSIKSIVRHPLFGVGIGNFPVVVGEPLAKAKAGSSAHNLYLHIAAEVGLPALAAALYFLWLVLRKCYQKFIAETDPVMLAYFAASLIFIPWNLFYSFTDVAIFDERAFLLFVTTIAIVLAKKNG